ncbi:MAG: hypothetical protein H0V43_04160 [Gemmatimonadales bacterium]|nr:hypothetical protein [Gemmatimonadales bacterium]
MCLLTAAFVLIPSTSAGQDIRGFQGWSLTAGGDGLRFGPTARNRTAPEQSAADLRPSGRAGVRATLAKSLGAWRLQLEAGLARGSAEVTNSVVAVRDKTLDLSRYRLSPALERRAAGLGPGELAVALAPTLDLWRAGGNNRFRLGVECRVAVRVPLGSLALENRVSLGLSGAPLEREDLGDGFELRGLRSLAVGVALLLPL